MSRLVRASVLLAAALLAAGRAPADEKLLFAGSDKAVWLVRADDDKERFDLAVRKLGGSWRWVEENLYGRPAAVAGCDDLLHVMFAESGAYRVFGPQRGDRTVELKPRAADWPANELPAALVAASGAGEPGQRGMWAAVVRPWRPRPAGTGLSTATAPAREPASAPATSPAAGPWVVGIFRRTGQTWTHLGDLPPVEAPGRPKVALAAAAQTLYALLGGEDGSPARLLAARPAASRSPLVWSEVSLAALAGRGSPVAMFGIRKRLILVLAAAAKDPARRKLVLAVRHGGEARFSFYPVAAGKQPENWPAEAMPLLAPLGEQVALVWAEGPDYQLATCDPASGMLVRKDKAPVFARGPLERGGGAVKDYFVWGVALAVLVPLLVLRPRPASPSFVLPEQMRPGHLGKRLIAALVDMVPFQLLGWVGLLIVLPPMSEEDATAMLKEALSGGGVPAPIAIAYVGVLAAYVIYGTWMEAVGGATLGKRLMKLRVIASGGEKPGLRLCLLRNVMKIPELMMPVPLIWALVPMLSRYRQRLGDMLAYTTVVEAAPSGQQTPAQGGGGAGPDGRPGGHRPPDGP